MGVHADNGVMMTKPYAAGGAYISKMSNYCKGCFYNPKLRVGENAYLQLRQYQEMLGEVIN